MVSAFSYERPTDNPIAVLTLSREPNPIPCASRGRPVADPARVRQPRCPAVATQRTGEGERFGFRSVAAPGCSVRMVCGGDRRGGARTRASRPPVGRALPARHILCGGCTRGLVLGCGTSASRRTPGILGRRALLSDTARAALLGGSPCARVHRLSGDMRGADRVAERRPCATKTTR
jgi:hypothetical protein